MSGGAGQRGAGSLDREQASQSRPARQGLGIRAGRSRLGSSGRPGGDREPGIVSTRRATPPEGCRVHPTGVQNRVTFTASGQHEPGMHRADG